jgi:hypothetical protein
MGKSVGINRNMSLDPGNFFTGIIAFFFCGISIFNRLGINYDEAGFGAATIVYTDLANYFFLKPCLKLRSHSRL